eukprot:TRINITY_DN11784_c0_g1_i1.p3 TRINITY_DN11784_c0_g1~~TRINITY_DN11784_c0_g1_i1.p3  ORF type:complete len:136 (-),score=36.30 TRINITY_DN11784_c0_g1_i1:303-710(-)
MNSLRWDRTNWSHAQFHHPSGNGVSSLLECLNESGDHLVSHFEFVRNWKGEVFPINLALYYTPMEEKILKIHSRESNIKFINSREYLIDPWISGCGHCNLAQIYSLKKKWDPKNLLNPGKLTQEVQMPEEEWVEL